MATSQTKSSEAQTDPSDVKRKLAWRMGFAGLMIVGLLGGLALFDRFSTQSGIEPSAPQFSEPVPVVKKLITQPLTPAEPTPETSNEPTKEPTAPESSAAPVDRSAQRAERPPRPEVSAQPTLPRIAPSSAHPAASQSKPTSSASVSPTRSASPVAAGQPAPPRLFSGYALQAGVFSDPRRAEELHARLILEGIPSSIEARVQAGPFKSRAEAEDAREKMAAMGIDAVMLLPKGVKR